jgi:type I restriction enzyme, R subunit
MVDESHRTQEGRLGCDMRDALPSARFFGLTGTPISDREGNSFKLFGDPADPGHVLNTYSMERSIADGASVPVHVASGRWDPVLRPAACAWRLVSRNPCAARWCR